MQKRIEEIKSSEEAGVGYMQAWEEKAFERQKGREDTVHKVCEKCGLSEMDAREYVENKWD